MTRALRTTTVLAVLVFGLAAAAAWGWSALTRPLPGLAEAPTCVETPVKAGDTVTTDQVTVSVLNAGKRSGLASHTMDELVAQGFHEGDIGDTSAEVEVGYAQIWTDDPNSPAVALLKAHLQRSKVVQTDISGWAGVVVVVGDKFDAVSDGEQAVQAVADTTICSPVE